MKAQAMDFAVSLLMLADEGAAVSPQNADFLASTWEKVKQNLSTEAVLSILRIHGPSVLQALAVFVFGRMLARVTSAMIVKASIPTAIFSEYAAKRRD